MPLPNMLLHLEMFDTGAHVIIVCCFCLLILYESLAQFLIIQIEFDLYYRQEGRGVASLTVKSSEKQFWYKSQIEIVNSLLASSGYTRLI